jgi:predicted nucleic acid-binding protein
MIVVSNASPLIGLALIDQLEVLPALYERIYIADATRLEVIEKGKRRPGAVELAQADWLVPLTVSRRALAALRPYPSGLRAGEIETIALALQQRADIVLIDERLARKFAQSKGLQVLGTLGVLKQAHTRGLLPDLRGALDALRACGFRFSDTLYRQILIE